METYLEHHGILGMHWGIRRFQNEDGTLTPAGKERYLKDKKFAAKYDAETAKRKKIENINKRQSGRITQTERTNINNSHSTAKRLTGIGITTMADEITYNFRAGNKRTKKGSAADFLRKGINVGINAWVSSSNFKTAQKYALAEYNDDGTKKVREGSAEQKKLKRKKSREQNARALAGQALKLVSSIVITKAANTDWGDTFNRGARQPYDVEGKWAKWQGGRLSA